MPVTYTLLSIFNPVGKGLGRGQADEGEPLKGTISSR